MSYYDTKISAEPQEWTIGYGSRKYKVMAHCQIDAMQMADRLLAQDLAKEKKEKFDKTIKGRILKVFGY